MQRGVVFACWRCGEDIHGRWDLGHVEDGLGVWLDFKGEVGRWPVHPRCNRKTMTHAKQRLAAAERDGRSQPPSTKGNAADLERRPAQSRAAIKAR